ncbi:protein TRACHEARY ELEMENT DIFFERENTIATION-RELATED 7A-like [Panicum virgatum]|uniref:protein TRACHEARY ELEMENT DIFFERENTIATION-RELATED 7A-like n=1 Tax=Panicum virgatum TaxID=38727 RepID=UPI0019D59664|nr:protein TRACHEARY ELEMENT DIFFERENTIATION-RELATED 7A-like [Panicum virgatum]
MAPCRSCRAPHAPAREEGSRAVPCSPPGRRSRRRARRPSFTPSLAGRHSRTPHEPPRPAAPRLRPYSGPPHLRPASPPSCCSSPAPACPYLAPHAGNPLPPPLTPAILFLPGHTSSLPSRSAAELGGPPPLTLPLRSSRRSSG